MVPHIFLLVSTNVPTTDTVNSIPIHPTVSSSALTILGSAPISSASTAAHTSFQKPVCVNHLSSAPKPVASNISLREQVIAFLRGQLA